MKKTLVFLIVLVPLVFAGTILTTETSPPDDDQPHAFLDQERTFEGVDRCKICHRKEEDGNQYGIWQEGPHAKAYDTLAGDEAKAIAAEKGIDNPQTAGECLKCHVTAHGVDEALLGSKYKITDGVGCESCHGAGGDYYKKSTMEGIAAGEIDPASVGLILPTEEVCVTCHNEESPVFKGFDFETMAAKIAHPVPAK